MNMAWLLGFTSFLIGSCLFPITLGVWWKGRYRLSFGRIAALSVLLCLGYFCHLVSLGLTVVGLTVLAIAGPVQADCGEPWRFRIARLLRTSVSFAPLLVLGYLYLQAARRSAPMQPMWENLWGARLGWVDPITLAVKDGLPFTSRVSRGFVVFAPAVWLSVALVFWWHGRMTGGQASDERHLADDPGAREPIKSQNSVDDRQGWLILAALLLLGGIIGPDSFGPAHGEFLPQRALLLGFIALVPVFDADLSRWSGRCVFAAITLAVVLQAAIVWDYALYCDATAGQIIRAGKLVGRNQRIITLLVSSKGRFRANPLLHAENWLGVDTGNVIWNNYEARHYYFPVRFRPEIERPDSSKLELISIHDDPNDQKMKAARLRDWEELMSSHAQSIDVVLFWKSDSGAGGNHQALVRSVRSIRATFRSSRGLANHRHDPTGKRPVRAILSCGKARNGRVPVDRSPAAGLLLLLQDEEVRFILDLGKLLGPVFAGNGDAERELLPIELVDHLGGLALGFLRAVFDRQVHRGVGLRLGVDLHLARIVGSIDGRLDLLTVEGPLGVDALAIGGPGSLEGLQKLGLRLVIAERRDVAPTRSPRPARATTASSVERPVELRIPKCFVKGMMVIPRRLQNPFAQAACVGALRKPDQ